MEVEAESDSDGERQNKGIGFQRRATLNNAGGKKRLLASAYYRVDLQVAHTSQ